MSRDWVPNPKGVGGFKDHPENRSDGGWKKEDSISYQYNKIMRMTEDEFKVFKPKTIAQKIALQRIKSAVKETGLKDTQEITDRTEGKAQQKIDVTSAGRPLGEVISELEKGSNYGRVAEEAHRQMVEAESPLQDKR